MVPGTRTKLVESPFDGLVQALEDDLPAVLDEVVRLLRIDWPDYAEFLSREREQVAPAGELAVRRIVETAERAWRLGRAVSVDEFEDDRRDLEMFAELGRLQWRRGQQLTDLQGAYHVGARVAWRVVSRTSVQHGVPADCVALLAEAVFVLVDLLSSTSARGYVEEQSQAVAHRERARAELADLLLSDRSDPAVVAAAADRAGWPVPARAAVLLVEPDDGDGRDRLSRVDPESLPVRRAGTVGVIVPDPSAPGRRARLAEALKGSGVVVGRTVPTDRLPASLRVTRLALRLHREGVLTGDPVFVEDHLDAVVVHSDDRLLDVLRSRVLAPLADVPDDTRERLEETLISWLRHMGDRQKVAAELHVHRQTVRYRLGQLYDLFGPALEDPSVRMQLLLALGWRGNGGAQQRSATGA